MARKNTIVKNQPEQTYSPALYKALEAVRRWHPHDDESSMSFTLQPTAKMETVFVELAPA